MFATLVRLVGDFDLAEEALHEAFRAALEQWPRDGMPANPRAWLVSAGRFKAVDTIRRRARFEFVEDFDEQPDPASQDAFARDEDCVAYDTAIRESGHCIASEALQPVQTATTVRVRNGGVAVTDGPFAETKEQLAGFYMIDAKDLNEAIRLAAGIPPARVGSIEVRPIRPIHRSEGDPSWTPEPSPPPPPTP